MRTSESSFLERRRIDADHHAAAYEESHGRHSWASRWTTPKWLISRRLFRRFSFHWASYSDPSPSSTYAAPRRSFVSEMQLTPWMASTYATRPHVTLNIRHMMTIGYRLTSLHFVIIVIVVIITSMQQQLSARWRDVYFTQVYTLA